MQANDRFLMEPPTPVASGSAASAEEEHVFDRVVFGRRLRAARKALGWTLAHVAALTGASITTISRAERGQVALSYEKFSALGIALQLDMGSLFAKAGAATAPMRSPVITRAGQGVVCHNAALHYELLGGQAPGKRMNPHSGTVLAREFAGPQDYVQHPGEAFLYVISGAMAVHFENGQVVQLARGDSLYFDSRMGHAYVSTSKQPARVVGVTQVENVLSP